MNMKALQQTSEHRPVACAPSGFVTRWIGSSGQHVRWAHRLKVYVPICALAWHRLWHHPAFAQSDLQFTKANQEYAQDHFKEAIAGYEALVHEGQWNANLFYDLGNAYFRTRDFGRAILNYERALALDRHHPEATLICRLLVTNRARWNCNRPDWSDIFNSRASISTASQPRLLCGWEFLELSR